MTEKTQTDTMDSLLSPVSTAFGIDKVVRLDTGREFVVPKWSVKKMMHLGSVMSAIVDKLLRILREYNTDEDLENVTVASLLTALPKLMDEASTELATVIESSLTLKGGKRQITREQILGEDEDDPENLDIDEFADVLVAIVERNLTKRTMGKWKRLFTGGLGLMTGPETSEPK